MLSPLRKKGTNPMTTLTPVKVIRVPVPMLGCDLSALETPDGVYFPVTWLSQALLPGVGEKSQRERVLRDPILQAVSRSFPVHTDGGEQEMLCIEWLGVGRFVDRVDVGRVREDLRERILKVQWQIAYAAYLIVSHRIVPEQAPEPVSLVLVDRPPEARASRGLPLSEADVRAFLIMLAERMGTVEASAREVQRILRVLAAPGATALRRCPHCGHTLDD